MSPITQAKRVVVKVGTSTLTYENGRTNLRALEALCKVLTDLQNAGHRMLLVSSGAIGVGVGKLGLPARPTETHQKQAVAAVGQCELMFLYDKLFGEYNQAVAQVLLTRDVIDDELARRNVTNTLQALLEMSIIPVINENDTVAIDELVGANIGDNDTLSAIVADITDADLLVLLTDIDGLYDADPRQNPDARPIPVVRAIDDDLLALAGGAGSKRGTGGMRTKLTALRRTMGRGIPAVIMRGDKPDRLYDLLDGQPVGTLFDPN
ncbi:MAG: glutamate 5-kinase [Acutalibacteraceae bacterium]